MDLTNFSMLLNKKTKVDDKIKFLESITTDINYESKLNADELTEILDFVREKYWKIIEAYYLSKS